MNNNAYAETQILRSFNIQYLIKTQRNSLFSFYLPQQLNHTSANPSILPDVGFGSVRLYRGLWNQAIARRFGRRCKDLFGISPTGLSVAVRHTPYVQIPYLLQHIWESTRSTSPAIATVDC